MSSALKCDRCGKLYERSAEKFFPYPMIKVFDEEFLLKNQRAYMEVEAIDLCDDCIKSFITWLHNG